MVIGIERDLNSEASHVSTIRGLKNRCSGDTGVACHIRFDPETTRLEECMPEETSDFGGNDDF